MDKLCKGMMIAAAFILAGSVQAGVIVGGTRLVYDGTKREASLSVKNPDSTAYLIQAWTDADGVVGDKVGSAKPPFVVTPPLFRLDANNENLIRIIRTGGSLPEDRESIYWMNVKSIPASEKSDKNVLQISVKTRIKLFYRPAGLKVPSEEDYKQVTFHRTGKQLTVTNPTPYYLTFFELKLGSTPVTTTDIVVPPKGSADYPLNTAATGSQVTWKVINDYGGSSKPVISTVK